MNQLPISVTIIALNEEENIRRALSSVKWADDVLVVDSGSTDRTVEIAKEMGARVIHNPWPGYGRQKNFAQKHASHDWVLNIDADEAVTEALSQEIKSALEEIHSGRSKIKGFFIPRKTFYLGRWIRHGGWYPNYLVRLADRRAASWTEPSVHESLRVEGETAQLKEPLLHYAFASIQDQILTNLRFSHLGSQDLKQRGQGFSVFKLMIKPFGKFMETYFLKGGCLDGLPGLIISINAAHSMFLKYAYLSEARIRNANSDH